MPSSPNTGASTTERAGDLMSALTHVPDPRDPRGVRYPLAGMLAVAVCAVLAGARSFTAIGEWALDVDTEHLNRLGLDKAPVESTVRKLFARIDAAALDAALAAFAWCRVRQVAGQRVIAIDGKTVRGARTAITGAPHLIAALDHASGVVLGQHAVDAKSNEIPAVRDLLTTFNPADVAGCVITVDAMHTQDDTAKTIVDAGADYVFTVKANRPALLKALKALPWNKIPIGSASTPARPRQTRHTNHQGHRHPDLSRLAAVHRRQPGRPTTTNRHQGREEDRRGRVSDHLCHQPRCPTHNPGHLDPRTLGHREQAPLGPRCDLRRRPPSSPHRRRAPCHGHPTQHRAQPAAPGRHQRYRHRYQTPLTPPRTSHHIRTDQLK